MPKAHQLKLVKKIYLNILKIQQDEIGNQAFQFASLLKKKSDNKNFRYNFLNIISLNFLIRFKLIAILTNVIKKVLYFSGIIKSNIRI